MDKKCFNQRLKGFILAATLVFFLPGCDYSYLDIEELPDYEYSSEWIFPLIKSNMSINSMFIDSDDQTVEIDDDDLVWLIYNGELVSISGSSAFNIANQSFDYSLDYTGTDKTTVTLVSDVEFTPDEDEEITIAVLDAGQMSILASCTQALIDNVVFEIYGTIIDSDDGSGNPVTFPVPVNSQHAEVIDLGGAVLNFGDNQTLSIELEITHEDGTPDNLPYTIDFQHQFYNMDFYELHGYFKQRSFSLGSDTVNLGFFSNVVEGVVFFKDPIIKLTSNNSYGIPIDINFDAFFSTHEEHTVDVDGSPVPDFAWRINHPGPDEVGEVVQTHYTINETNSNIHEIMEILPRRVAYEVRGETNPDGDEEINHLRNDSYFDIGVEVQLPLHGYLNLAGFVDTVDFSIPSELDMIEWLELNINMVNGMPVSTYLTIDFYDSNDNRIITLFKDEDGNPIAVAESAEVDDDGSIISTTLAQSTITLVDDQIANIENTEYLVIKARVTSYEADIPRNIKIFSSNELNTFIGIKLGINQVISFSDDD